MSIRTEINKTVRVDSAGSRNMEDATIYATTKEEALSVYTSNLLLGSTLFVLQTMDTYLLDDDGGAWRSTQNGTELV